MAPISSIDYLDSIDDKDLNVESCSLVTFFNKLVHAVKEPNYSQEKFNEIIDQCFNVGVPIPPRDVFKHCLYGRQSMFKDKQIIQALDEILRYGGQAFAYNTGDLVLSILNTRDEILIKKLLKALFRDSRNGTWSSLDSLIASTYLIQRKMKHKDLRNLLSRTEPGFSWFCESFCVNDFLKLKPNDREVKTIQILKLDDRSKYLFVQYLRAAAESDVFESTSYFRAYFDRFSSYVLYRVQKPTKKFKAVFKERDLKDIYRSIPEAEEKIRIIEKRRQQNPLIHAGSELLDKSCYKEEMEGTQGLIKDLMEKYLDTLSIDQIHSS